MKNLLRKHIALGRKTNEFTELFTAWIKPHNSKQKYKKVENCRITCGFKTGCYGINSKGKTFDHIPIEQFNDKERYTAIGDIYDISLIKPY